MAEQAAATGTPPAPALDELMMAMDVVDTLRHHENIALKELEQDGRDDGLKERLRHLYESQGLTVSDHILEEGIRALKESRFTYAPTSPGSARWLAGLWVRRGFAAKCLGVIAIILIAWSGWGIWRQNQAERLAAAVRTEMTQVLPKQLQTATQAAMSEARTPDAKARVEELGNDGETALSRSDSDATRAAISALDRLRAQLAQSYVLRVVTGPSERSGVFRIPNINTGARNYYLIVEAVTPDGRILEMPVTNEENGRVKTVSRWGIRVPLQTYDALRLDKQDDGIIQNNIVGEKPRGALKPVYGMVVSNGAITEW